MDIWKNELVSALSREDGAALITAGAQLRTLNANEVLSSPGEPGQTVYLLTGAVVAQVAGEGASGLVAVRLVGWAGVVGLHLAIGAHPGSLTSIVQSSGEAWTLDASALGRLADIRRPVLTEIARYLWAESQQFAVYSENLQRQTVAQRLARWLVDSCGPLADLPLDLTHVHLASMLGVRRATVSSAATELRDLGIVEYTRGKIVVRDMQALLQLSRSRR